MYTNTENNRSNAARTSFVQALLGLVIASIISFSSAYAQEGNPTPAPTVTSTVAGAPAPVGLPTIPIEGFSWEKWLSDRMSAIEKVPVEYRTYAGKTKQDGQFKAIVTTYGLIEGNSDSRDPLIELIASNPYDSKEVSTNNLLQKRHSRGMVVSTFLKSEKLQEVFAKWYLSAFLERFETLDGKSKAIYREAIWYGLNYLKEFDLTKEEEHLKKCDVEYDSYYENAPPVFTQVDPMGIRSPYRKVGCFLFRRIRDDGFSPKVLEKFAEEAFAKTSVAGAAPTPAPAEKQK